MEITTTLISKADPVISKALYLNQTTSGSDLNLTNSTFEEASISAISGLTYALFSLTCCFTVLGLCGNGLIIATLSKFGSLSKGHGILLTTLAICDSVALASTALIQPCVHDIFGMDIRASNTIGCKTSCAILLSAVFSSTSTVVLICIERFLAVCCPHKSKTLLTEKNIVKAIWICLTPVALIFVTTSILYAELREEDGSCYPNFDGSQFSTVLNRMPDTSVYNIIVGFIVTASMLILLIFTPMTIIKLYKQRVIRSQYTTSVLLDSHYKTSVKLTAIAVAHVTLLVIPSIVMIGFGLMGIIIDKNTLSAITMTVLLNHSINFLLYDIFDPNFRRNVLFLIGCTKSRRKIVLRRTEIADTNSQSIPVQLMQSIL